MRALVRMGLTMLLAPASIIAGELTGQVSIGGGYDTNPAGYYSIDPQALGWTRLALDWRSAFDRGTAAIEYRGNAYSFVPQSSWSAHGHALDASWSETTLSGLKREFGVGGQGNWNDPIYAAYTYRELSSFGGVKASVGNSPVELAVRIRRRWYPESPEFDHRQLSLAANARRSLPTRTTIGVGADIMGRTYTTQTSEDIYAGIESATSRRVRGTAFVSQGLTESTGLRLSGWVQDGNGRSRWTDDYWDVLDDPLGRTGFGARMQFSVLAPAGATVRFYAGGERVDIAYVTADGAYGTRSDGSLTTGILAEGLLPWSAGGRYIRWNAEVGAERRSSDDSNYSFQKLKTTFGLRYAW